MILFVDFVVAADRSIFDPSAIDALSGTSARVEGGHDAHGNGATKSRSQDGCLSH
jgi:hypothetical protein